MIGICPHCKIDLKQQPFGKRETNEMLIVMNYRRILESKSELKNISELGYCEVCNATTEDINIQKEIILAK